MVIMRGARVLGRIGVGAGARGEECYAAAGAPSRRGRGRAGRIAFTSAGETFTSAGETFTSAGERLERAGTTRLALPR
jgi:hypothetical protein